MTEPLDPDQLRALAAAVSEGTFEAAAHALHVTPSAISQRIKALETRTGRVLLRRAKPITATASGEVLLRAARQLEAIAADVAAQLGEDREANRAIPLAVNADSLATWLLPALRTVSGSLRFDLRRDDETRTAALLRDGSVMAAVTASATPVPGCTVRPLGAMRYRPCASPAFVAEHLAAGAVPDELATAPVVTFDRGDVLQAQYLRRRSRRALDPPRHYVPGSGAFVQAVSLGFGWGMIPDLQSAPALAAGELIVFDPDGAIDVRLYWQQWRVRSQALERVAAAVLAAATDALS